MRVGIFGLDRIGRCFCFGQRDRTKDIAGDLPAFSLCSLRLLVIFSRRALVLVGFAGRPIHVITHFHDELYYSATSQGVGQYYRHFWYICVLLSFYLSAVSFGVPDSFDYVLIVPILMSIAFVPVTIAGLGTREAASPYFFP